MRPASLLSEVLRRAQSGGEGANLRIRRRRAGISTDGTRTGDPSEDRSEHH